MPLLHKSRREILDAIRSLPSLADLVAMEDGRFKYELDLEVIRQGVSDKLAEVKAIAASMKLRPEEIAYIGDDLPDLPAVRFAGLGVTVADAPEELRSAAHYVTSVPGGRGAVREVVEVLLKNTGRWEGVIRKYVT